ncbi:hypothetical protein CXF85_10140 [Colwellia sp. 75C3]|nr:hypothetical protein CXF85_10140 [Colwellia sp. 75C3]
MKLNVLLLTALVFFIGDSFAYSTPIDCDEVKGMSGKSLEKCLEGDSNNVLNDKNSAEQKTGEFVHAQKVFDALMACGKNFDVSVGNTLVINCLEKLTFKMLQVRLLSKIVRWTSIVKSYQPLTQCDDATLQLYPNASLTEVELVRCFEFEAHEIQTGLVYYSVENAQLKISGIQF